MLRYFIYYFEYFLQKVKNKTNVMNYSFINKRCQRDRNGIAVEECLLTYKGKRQVVKVAK